MKPPQQDGYQETSKDEVLFDHLDGIAMEPGRIDAIETCHPNRSVPNKKYKQQSERKKSRHHSHIVRQAIR